MKLLNFLKKLITDTFSYVNVAESIKKLYNTKLNKSSLWRVWKCLNNVLISNKKPIQFLCVSSIWHSDGRISFNFFIYTMYRIIKGVIFHPPAKGGFPFILFFHFIEKALCFPCTSAQPESNIISLCRKVVTRRGHQRKAQLFISTLIQRNPIEAKSLICHMQYVLYIW